MRVLKNVEATSEQQKLFQHRYLKGPLVVRGAAGSGKTTTALLRLHHLRSYWSHALSQEGREPSVLVLTFNRTLRGYVKQLAAQQAEGAAAIEVDTFGMWAMRRENHPRIVGNRAREAELQRLAVGCGLNYPKKFIADEVAYVTGRLQPEDLDEYPTSGFERDGRGIMPRVTRAQRRTLLEEVIRPYEVWKQKRGEIDWNDLSVRLTRSPKPPFYDIVVVDETQDFTANSVRALLAHVEERSSITFVLDGAQRIYPNFFKWREVGIMANPRSNICRLMDNYRNTQEIAAFARPLVAGLKLGDDASLPDLDSCKRSGSKPTVLRGLFSEQLGWCLAFINNHVDLANETVAFLHAQGGGYFDYLRAQLKAHELSWVELQATRDWPTGPVNIGLCTMQSAKGLEFDHVFAIGLDRDVLDCGNDPNHQSLESARRLLAMAITRAKHSVAIGFKVATQPEVVRYLDSTTYQEVNL